MKISDSTTAHPCKYVHEHTLKHVNNIIIASVVTKVSNEIWNPHMSQQDQTWLSSVNHFLFRYEYF